MQIKASTNSRAVDTDVARQHQLFLQCFRLLVADLCEQFNGGHAGSAMGMAAMGLALWKYIMRYAPHQPNFLNRDRFVLSNGHAGLMQYIFLHLTGYKHMTMEHLKSYNSSRIDSHCPAHPEIESDGIEVTTGPLGQGVANAVGMAMATKHLGATYNRPGFELVTNHTWCIVGDACLQEGVALEAISLAGHFKLNNLTIIYDNNQITCDGSVDITNTEDINAKMEATGWNILNVEDGSYDVQSLISVLTHAKNSIDKPTFINVRTVIGLGSAVAGTSRAHVGALGAEDVATMKRGYGFDPGERFCIPDTVRGLFSDCVSRGDYLVKEWQQLFQRYGQAYPTLAAELSSRIQGQLPADWESYIPTVFPLEPTASRISSGLVFNPICEKVKSFMAGSADLSDDAELRYPGMEDFQHPDLRTQCGMDGSYSGRYIRFGIREHAMVAIANGLAGYQRNMIVPVTSSFLMFYLYAAAAVRMGAMQRLQVIHAATHDSIGIGHLGPTHQPLEVAALFRAMPNLLYIRPGDTEETAGAWIVAIRSKNTPSIISTSRHKLPQLVGRTNRAGVANGAYILEESSKADVTLIGVGGELGMAAQVAEMLRLRFGRRVRLVSFPCHRLFESQPLSYRRQVLGYNSGIPIVVIEPYVALGWERYCNAAVCMSTMRYGHSLPSDDTYKMFGFEITGIATKITEYLNGIERKELHITEFCEL